MRTEADQPPRVGNSLKNDAKDVAGHKRITTIPDRVSTAAFYATVATTCGIADIVVHWHPQQLVFMGF